MRSRSPWFVEYAVPPGSVGLDGGEVTGPLRIAPRRSGLDATGEFVARAEAAQNRRSRDAALDAGPPLEGARE